MALPRHGTVTLLHKNCGRNCNICAYGALEPVSYARISDIVDALMARGARVQLYDFDVTNDSIAIFRKTHQLEGANPGWLNVTADFDPSPENAAYVDQLDTAIVISLHGSTPAIHHRASSRKDFADIVRFLEEYPRRFSRPLGINYVVGRHNAGDVADMVRFAARFDLEFLEFIPLGFSGNAVQRMGESAILSPREKHEVYRAIVAAGRGAAFAVELDAIWGPDFARNPQAQCRFFAPPVPGEYCNAGINHLAIRLNDNRVFPCPCMASVDALACGTFADGALVIDESWMEHKERIGEPCQSCAMMARCQGGCRLTAMSDYAVAHGEQNRYAGFASCLYALTVRYGH